jgi:hypothetical protein
MLVGLLFATGCSSSDKSSSDKDKHTDKATSTTIDSADAYNVGCPAVDTALGAGYLARKAASVVLGKLAGNDNLSSDQREWLKDAKELVSASKPDDVPGSVRGRISKACKDHGHPLSNL